MSQPEATTVVQPGSKRRMLRNGWNWLVHSFRGMTLVTTRFEAFLSYTRPDDRFFGGNITAMCQVLELACRW